MIEEYLRVDRLPHIWCPGCGNGIVTGAILRAIVKEGLDPDKTVIVSGIGCSSRAPGYMNFDTVHTTHGRALPFATGIKLANPDLNVIVISGDGDSSAIGGNHLIHTARRNIDITMIIINNNIYGMTSGQYSPLTPTGKMATTAPYGNIDRPFNLCGLVGEAGATYVARATAYHTLQLQKYIENGLKNKGFSMIEAVSPCPTYFGRKNKLSRPVQMMDNLKERAIMYKEGMAMTQDENTIYVGELKKITAPEYTASYDALIQQLKEEA